MESGEASVKHFKGWEKARYFVRGITGFDLTFPRGVRWRGRGQKPCNLISGFVTWSMDSGFAMVPLYTPDFDVIRQDGYVKFRTSADSRMSKKMKLPVTSHQLKFTSHRLQVTNHQSKVTSHVTIHRLPVIRQRVRSHKSSVTSHIISQKLPVMSQFTSYQS
jgi:hypothetical protein